LTQTGTGQGEESFPTTLLLLTGKWRILTIELETILETL